MVKFNPDRNEPWLPKVECRNFVVLRNVCRGCHNVIYQNGYSAYVTIGSSDFHIFIHVRVSDSSDGTGVHFSRILSFRNSTHAPLVPFLPVIVH